MEAPLVYSAVAERPPRKSIWLVCVGLTMGAGLLALQRTTQQTESTKHAVELVDDTPKVRVDLYGMAGCPFTRGFINGPVAELLSTMPELVDFNFYPFGNSYYITEQCGGSAEGYPFASYFSGYDATVRECWDRECGASATEPAADCFSGQLLCQHGATDGLITTAWACAKDLSNDQPLEYMPFVWCTSHRFLSVTDEASFQRVVSECQRDLPVLQCASGSQGRDLYNHQARLTVPHGGVPYVLVAGEVLDDTGCVACGDGVIPAVCKEWRRRGGTESPVCAGIFGEI